MQPVAASALACRWLISHGCDPDAAQELAVAAAARVSRYPAAIRAAYGPAEAVIRWLAPAVCLGEGGPAESLPPAVFETLQQRLADHPSPVLRAAFLLFRLPLFEVLLPEPAPDPISHPLERYLPSDLQSGPQVGRGAGIPVATRSERSAELFDVLVIGSGAGGAPVAWSLASQGARVGLVESGGLVQPSAVGPAIERYYLHQAFVMSLPGCVLPVLAGEALGGTTAINSGTCLRPDPERLEAWDRVARTDFSGGGLDRWFDEAERRLGVCVPPWELLGASAHLVAAGLERLGMDRGYVLPRNAPGCQGRGRCCFGCPSGAKNSTDRAFLPQAAEAGCELFTGFRATRIQEDRDHVQVEVKGPGGSRALRARLLVIAAGALGTPHLLRANRLGTSWRRAGGHLRVHPAVKVFAHFPVPIDADRGVPQGLGFRAPDFPRANFEGIFTPRAAAAKMMAVAGERQRRWLDEYRHVASFGMLVRDRSFGSVITGGPMPLIWYRMHPEDARDLARGARLIAEAFFAAGADRVLVPVFGMASEIASQRDLAGFRPAVVDPEQLLAGALHPHGTAGIGRVVSPDLRLLGSSRIYVSDASVLPDSPGVNPMVTIVALALRLGYLLGQQLQRDRIRV